VLKEPWKEFTVFLAKESDCVRLTLRTVKVIQMIQWRASVDTPFLDVRASVGGFSTMTPRRAFFRKKHGPTSTHEYRHGKR